MTNVEEKRLESELSIIPPFLAAQARKNLTGNARDLWIAGIENIKDQEKDLDFIRSKVDLNNLSLLKELGSS